jgi:hypothetical protein
MSGQTGKALPKNAMEAQGLLIKAVYEKYGREVLPLIEDALGRQGRALGLKVKSKLPDSRLSSVGAAFAAGFDPSTVDVVAISDDIFHIRGKGCPFGLENTSRELCEAVMAIDREYFLAATDGRALLTIQSTRADGGDVCDTLYKTIPQKMA